MRLESSKKVVVRGAVIGGPRTLICLPLVGEDRTALLAEAKNLAKLAPDLVEWRVDGFGKVTDKTVRDRVLRELRDIFDQIPLIFTCRSELEGGMQTLATATRLEIILDAIQSKTIDLVDIELCNENDFISSVLSCARQHDISVILSHHNFSETPESNFIIEKLVEAQNLGADIAKIAVMPQNNQDLLTLLSATDKARRKYLEIPVITISMAQRGVLSRIAGGVFGSDVTFGAGVNTSAPGQIGFRELQQAMRIIEGEKGSETR